MDIQSDLVYYGKVLWRYKYLIISIVFITSVASIIASYVADEVYEVKCLIDPAEATDETSLVGMSAFGNITLTGVRETPTVKQITLVLKSDRFLSIFFEKYKNNTALFDKTLTDIDASELSDLVKQEKKYQEAIKYLKKVIDFNRDSDNNTIVIKVSLKNKYFACNFLNEVLFELKEYIRKENISSLERDIENYKKIITLTNDPSVINKLQNRLSSKMLNKYELTSNVFSVIDPPSIPYKRISPRRTYMVVTAFLISVMISVLGVVLFHKLKNTVNEILS